MTYLKRLKQRKAVADQPDAAWEALADGNKNITLSLEECCPPSTPCMEALKTIYSIYPQNLAPILHFGDEECASKPSDLFKDLEVLLHPLHLSRLGIFSLKLSEKNFKCL